MQRRQRAVGIPPPDTVNADRPVAPDQFDANTVTDVRVWWYTGCNDSYSHIGESYDTAERNNGNNNANGAAD